MDERKYQWMLLGEEVAISTDKDEGYINRLYDRIVAKLEEVEKIDTAFPMSHTKKALFACVFLANDLLEQKAINDELAERIEALERSYKPKK